MPSTLTPSVSCRSSIASSTGSASSRSSATTCPAKTALPHPTAPGLLLLLKNLLLSREPLYGVGQWAARLVPERLGLAPPSPTLNDDRVGRCLDRLFDADIPSLTLAVVTHAVREFAVALDELHNDSTTVTFHGDYETADRSGTCGAGRDWPSPGDTIRTTAPTSSNCSTSSPLRATAPCRCSSASRAATPPTTAPRRHLGPPLQADRPPRLPVCGRLQAGHRREHGLHPSARRPVPERLAPHPRRGCRLPRGVLTGRVHWRPIHDKYDDEGELVIGSRSTSRR